MKRVKIIDLFLVFLLLILIQVEGEKKTKQVDFGLVNSEVESIKKQVDIGLVDSEASGIVGYIYIVKEGDSLSKIAKEHNTQVEKIIRWNNIEGKAILFGQALIIYK